MPKSKQTLDEAITLATKRRFLGVDPGMGGGLAVLPQHGSKPIAVDPMPATERDVWDWIYHNAPSALLCFGVIEQVHAMPKQGVSSTFKFGTSYGGLRMALTAVGIPWRAVTPQRWQKELGITPRKPNETPTQWKNRLKATAQQLFPSVKVTLKTADALLIAEFCRRSHV